MHIVRPAVLLVASAAFLGCGDSSSASADADRQSAPGAVGRAPTGGAGDATADMEELRDYELNMEDLEKFTVAQLNIIRASKGMPEEADDSEDEASGDDDATGEDPNSIGGMESRIESIPVMRKAVEDAGLDAREYATISLSYMTSAMAAAMVKMGTGADSVATAMKVNPDNIDFIMKHEVQITALMDRMKAEAAKLEGGD